MPPTQVKICGIKTPDAMTAALDGGAEFVGFLFEPNRPCTIEAEVAAYLASYVPATITIVGVFQNPTDEALYASLSQCRIDMIQLHGQESPERVLAVKQTYDRPVMKALSLKTPDDAALIKTYESVADWLLFDAAQGGSGKTFDWNLLEAHCARNPIAVPWMLAGGLTPQNVMEAIRLTHPHAVDVSSGVEAERGVKDPAKIHAFIKAAKTL